MAGHLPGPYQPLARLGQGAEGPVWLARDPGLDRLVTLKQASAGVLGQTGADRDAALRAMAAVSHPALSRLYTLAGPPQAPWLVAEYVAGRPLSEAREVPVSAVLLLAVELLSALAALQGGGVVHGDIAPGNIIVDTGGGPRLVDFGLARLAGEPATGAGTAGFVAPWSRPGAPASPAADSYGLGALLCWLLCGEAPRVSWDHEGNPLMAVPAAPTAAASQPGLALWTLIGALLASTPDACPDPRALLRTLPAPADDGASQAWLCRWAAEGVAPEPLAPTAGPRRRYWLWVVPLVLAVGGVVAWLANRPTEPPRQVRISVAKVDIEPGTVLPEGFSVRWVSGAVATRLVPGVELVTSGGAEELAFSVQCREHLCQLFVEHGQGSVAHWHPSLLPAPITEVVWTGAVSDLGRRALDH